MTKRTVTKIIPFDEDIIFTTDDIIISDRLSSELAHNFITITSLDGSKEPIIPTDGTYDSFVEAAPRAGFQQIQNNGTIDAKLTGGTAMPLGESVSADYASNTNRIRINANGILGALFYEVTILQNLT